MVLIPPMLLVPTCRPVAGWSVPLKLRRVQPVGVLPLVPALSNRPLLKDGQVED